MCLYVSVCACLSFLRVFCWTSLISFPLARVNENLCLWFCILEYPVHAHPVNVQVLIPSWATLCLTEDIPMPEFCPVWFTHFCKRSALINSRSTALVQISHYHTAMRVHLSFFRCETFLGISYVHLGKQTVESSVQRSLRSPMEAPSLELRWRAFLQCLFPITLEDWRAGTRSLENCNVSKALFSLLSLSFTLWSYWGIQEL